MPKQNSLKLILIILEAFLVLNLVLIPKFFVVYIFTGMFLYLIYWKFAEDKKKFLYFSTLLFSIIYLSLYMPLGGKYSIYYFYVSLFIYTIMYFINVFKNWKEVIGSRFMKSKYVIFFYAFAVYAVLGIGIAAHRGEAVKQVIVYGIMFCFMLMLVNENKNMEDIKKTFRFLGYVYSGVLFLGTLEVFGIKYGLRNHFIDYGISFETFSFAKRIPVTFFYNPNNYAALLVMAMILIFGVYIFTKEKRTKIYLGILYFVSQIQLIFTTSRTAWITLFIVFFFAFIIFCIYRQKELGVKTLKVIIATLLVFFIMSLMPFMASYYGKFATIMILAKMHLFSGAQQQQPPMFAIGQGGSLNERFTILYDVAHGVFLQKHFLGFGAGNTIDFVKSMHNTSGVINIHSLVFEVLGDFGIPMLVYALFIYFSMSIDLLKKLTRNKVMTNKYSLALGLCTFGFIFLSFGPSTVITFIPFWLLMGMSASMIFVREKEEV